MVEREEGEDRAEPDLRRGRREVRLEDLAAPDELEQPARDDQVGKRHHDQRHEVVRERELPRDPAAEREGVAGRDGGEREGRGLERGGAPGAPDEPREQGGEPGDERAAPGPEHDHRGQVDARGDAEDALPDRFPDPAAVGILEQLGSEGGGAEQRERRERAADGSEGSGHGHAETGRHGCVGEEGMPHRRYIGSPGGAT